MPLEYATADEFEARWRDPLVGIGTATPARTVVVVDLAAVPTGLPARPFGLPAVVVGLVTSASTALDLEPCDLALAADDPRIDRVATTVEQCPRAALTLATLLRRSAGTDTATGLLVESAAYGVLQAGPEYAHWRRTTPRQSPSATGAPLVVERHAGRLRLVLHRPERRNALDRAMRDALAEQLALVDADPSIEEVVIEGTGPAFCSGGDLDEFDPSVDPASAHLVRLERSLGALLDAVRGRVTVRLHGACIGSGIELAAFAGHVVADDTVSIGLPEVSMGLIPGAGGTVSLTRRIGRHRVCQLALTGERIDGPTALDWGLVDELNGG